MFKSILTYQPDKGLITTQPSQTIPDETMSMRELVSRHSRGLPIKGINKEAIFQPEQMGVPFEALDISERHELMEQTQEKIQEVKKRYNFESKKRQDAKRQEEIDKEVEKRLKEKENPTQA